MSRMLRTMMQLRRLASLALLGVVLLAAPAGATAPPEVRDNARLFDPPTIEKVNAIVQEIQQRFHKDLTIETFAELTEGQKQAIAAGGKAGKEEFYEHWLRQEAQAAGTDGVFILIVQNPGRLQVGVGDVTRTRAFTIADRDELRDGMLKDFRAREFDKGLITGATFVLRKMEQNLGGHPPITRPGLPGNPGGPTTRPVESGVPSTRPTTRLAPASTTEPKSSTLPSPGNDASHRDGTADSPKSNDSPKTQAGDKSDGADKSASHPKPDAGSGTELNK
ncbi:MAG TPA: TPM domain-containing protein [Tepidisphaeraceae bacterium]|nr:TPM domain-containing protein [Tepidisphaeraceae bacterium]